LHEFLCQARNDVNPNRQTKVKPIFPEAFTAGAERVTVWSDLLDDINVFPVADGDTGRNLSISLGPLRRPEDNPQFTAGALLLAARGNSGNIAAQFFSGLLMTASLDTLADAARTGRDRAWKAVHDPVPGTMLTVFDALVNYLTGDPPSAKKEYLDGLIGHLAEATQATTALLPRLRHAGVVDAGALGMFLFFEGFFRHLGEGRREPQPLLQRFPDGLRIGDRFQEQTEEQYCVDSVIRVTGHSEDTIGRLSEISDSLVVIPHEQFFKIHLHTADLQEVRERFESIGDVIRWEEDDLQSQVRQFNKGPLPSGVHIMTDAAGSISREDARRLGITLLDSYLVTEDGALPETRFSPEKLYRLLRAGKKISTSQASVLERHQHYQKALQLHQRVVYLCVGSVYTGNYATAAAWKQENDPSDRFTLIDSTAASGRLGTVAIAAARLAAHAADDHSVVDYINRMIQACEELIFLDRLKYLAAGGRLSKKSAFFGELLHLKPIVSPTAEGAVRVGAARSRQGQIRFALQRLAEKCTGDAAHLIMLEFTDNRQWVTDAVLPRIREAFPNAECLLQPMSLTAGVHMGPGTWALAYLPSHVLMP
jgi:DegV family protein with EDD domain